jgi:hypothetical protein
VALVAVGLTAVIGAATLIGLSGRTVADAGRSVAAPTTAPASLPPDKDPSRPEFRQAALADTIGAPNGFALVRNGWSGRVLDYQYAMHCRQGTCATDPVAAIASWAAVAGAGGTEFAAANLPTCLRSECATSYPRAGFQVALTAFSTADTSYSSRPGDVVYLTGVRIQQM